MRIVPNVTIIIPSVFHAQLVWFLQTNAQYLRDFPVIIITSDQEITQVLLDSYLPEVSLIAIPKPLGFAKTVNLGFKAATTEWVVTCNDDVTLSDKWLETLIDNADERTGGINPVISAPDGTTESAGIKVLPIGKAQPTTHGIPHRPFQTEALNAACVVYRLSAVKQVGFFDESFGSYLEDIDLSLSLLKAGWSQLVVPSVHVTHQCQQTSSKVLGWKKSFYDLRNWWLILFKHWSWHILLTNLPGILMERMRNLSGLMKAVFAR